MTLLLPAFDARAQQAEGRLEAALQDPAVAASLEHLREERRATAELLVAMGTIVSPSGAEHDRADFVAEQMRAIGLQDVQVTASPNAVGVIPGRSEGHLVFVSTLDDLATVAEHQRSAGAPPSISGDRVLGPGTNTSVTTAAMLAAADAYLSSGQRPEHTLVFAAVAQEETGLIGMRELFDRYGDSAEAFIEILGDGHSISYGALGIHWWRIVATGPPGHTLGGGLPNVNQAIGRSVDRILSLPNAQRGDDTRTRINISMLDSGSVFNHKPESGWFSLDLRSMEAHILDEMEEDIRQIITQVAAETAIDLEMEPVQLTPGGQIPGAAESRLVTSAAAISRWLGYEPRMSDSGSSNMNIAVAAGVPAIGLGGSRGGDRGTPDEWADIDGLMRTARQVVLLSVLLGGHDEN